MIPHRSSNLDRRAKFSSPPPPAGHSATQPVEPLTRSAPLQLSTQEMIADLKGQTCLGCKGTKKRGHSFCPACYCRLPRELKSSLYNLVGEGYEQAFTSSLQFLSKRI